MKFGTYTFFYHLRPMKRLLFLLPVILLFSCQHKRKADLILYNGTIYTVDGGFSVTEAMVVRNGKVLSVGPSADILEDFEAPKKIDLNGQFVYPGFIDSHCHSQYTYTLKYVRNEYTSTTL